MSINFKNRGRFQAQGDNVQESESWSQDIIPNKNDGHNLLTCLRNKLKSNDLKKRESCFEKAERFVNQAGKQGYDAQVVTSFFPSPFLRDVRVDVEIRKGKAFRD